MRLPFDCAEMAVLTISLALAIGPFGKLAVDGADVRNNGFAGVGIESQKQRGKQKDS